jgi:GGDEF domain-containing protein
VVARETGEEGAARLAERIRATVESGHFEYEGRVVPLTLSLGFAVAEVEVLPTAEAVTAAAAAALDRARKAGGNRCELHRLPAPPPLDG